MTPFGTRAVVACLTVAGLSGAVGHAQAPAAAAWMIRSFEQASRTREARPDVLDTPLLPGSLMKAITLVAALEHDVIRADTTRICRRIVTVNGRGYACAHPDLKRPLTPAEALAHSCNDFFISLAGRLSRTDFNDVRARAGLPPLAASDDLAPALVGLDGPLITPRALLQVFARLIGVPGERPVTMRQGTRRALLEGLRGAASFGTASELAARKISALAKTGTTRGRLGVLGLMIAFTPADAPRQGLIVVAPGAAGRDATSIAADILAEPGRQLRIGATDGSGRVTVEHVPLEAYVARVVAAEAGPRAPAAAREALAIVVRTFALANRNRHGRDGFDLCDTTHCQVARRETGAARQAADATAGRVLVHRGRLATVFYSAWCGGRAELASRLWPGAVDDATVAHGREDEACRDEPAWTSELSAGEIERSLSAAGRRGRLRDLVIVRRNAAGRVVRLRAEGYVPPEISGEDFRLAVGRVVGWERLKSTAFAIQRSARGYRMIGRGSGHGVGMCVIGAEHRGARGATVDEILRFYYPGLKVSDIREDVRLRLPAAEEGEREHLTRLVRATRDDVAKRSGASAPSRIDVTVHPTVETFQRATRQPWWIAGASRETRIDLLPVAMLRKQGQLERTIRHEVAHVVLDAALKDRPLWVREGAASYFTGSAIGAATAAPRTCPADVEFTQATTAASVRGLYQRAAACFRRQLTAGASWREVR